MAASQGGPRRTLTKRGHEDQATKITKFLATKITKIVATKITKNESLHDPPLDAVLYEQMIEVDQQPGAYLRGA